jgi:methylthioribose-1-phosphate isomerase
MQHSYDTIRAVRWEDDHLVLLDQRRLPGEEVDLHCHTATDAAGAIRDMVVRGAPAIGITAAYAVVLSVRTWLNAGEDWRGPLIKDIQQLRQARPTAVNLFWALDRMQATLSDTDDSPDGVALAEAQRIHHEDILANHQMGDQGAAFIQPGSGVLTHCNTGSLATGGYGTALGVIRSAYAEKKLTRIYADETRPWLQGARLTAWELLRDGIPVDLIVEGAAAALMCTGQVDWVIVGADRVAANGDVANKIGTYALAVLARQHGVRFMVVAPSSTVDLNVASGEDIPIEIRSKEEVLRCSAQTVAAEGAGAWNPVFDVTPADLIDVLVTERGAVESPDRDVVLAMMQSD